VGVLLNGNGGLRCANPPYELAWVGGGGEPHREAHYPSIKPKLVELTSALHGLAHDADMRAQYIKDAAAFADRFTLPSEQRHALISSTCRPS